MNEVIENVTRKLDELGIQYELEEHEAVFTIEAMIQLGLNKKSLAFSVVFTPKDEEFTPEMIDGFVCLILVLMPFWMVLLEQQHTTGMRSMMMGQVVIMHRITQTSFVIAY